MTSELVALSHRSELEGIALQASGQRMFGNT